MSDSTIRCPACGTPVLVVYSRQGRRGALAFDPVPDGDGEHFDTVLSEDLSRVSGSGDAIARSARGRFPLYRAHAWTCPERLAVPGGKPVPSIGGYWQRAEEA